jgi:hypothetical protein
LTFIFSPNYLKKLIGFRYFIAPRPYRGYPYVMQQVLDLCPQCGCSLGIESIPPDWISFYPLQKRWAIKQSIIFKDPLDGELYQIWKCSECRYTWDSLDIKENEDSLDKKE